MTVVQIEDAFLTLFDHIRADPVFKDVTVLIVPENNYGNEAAALFALVQRHPRRMNNAFVLYENPHKVGFCTTENSKIKGYDKLKTYACISGVRFYERFITINQAIVGDGPAIMKQELLKQMGNLKQFGRKKANGKTTVFVSCIHNAEGHRLHGNDDIVVALMLLVLHMDRLMRGELDIKIERLRLLRLHRVHVTEEYGYNEKLAHMSKEQNEEQLHRQLTSKLF